MWEALHLHGAKVGRSIGAVQRVRAVVAHHAVLAAAPAHLQHNTLIETIQINQLEGSSRAAPTNTTNNSLPGLQCLASSAL